MQSQLLLIALGATLFGAQNAAAEDTDEKKIYADLGYSRIGTDLLETDPFDSSIEFGSVGGHVGYQFSKHWSVEGEALFGVENDKRFGTNVFPTVDGDTSVSRSVKTDLSHLVGVHVKGTLPITRKLNAFARIGVASGEFDYTSEASFTNLATEETTTNNLSGTYTETGVALGAGLSFDVSDKIYLRGDYTQYDLIDVEMDSFSLGIGVRF